MDFKEDIKSGVKLMADAASDIAQALVEKNRLRANANRIKQVIKGDCDTRNQAYIEIGRYYYENLRDKANEETEQLCVVVDKTTARIDKASKRYIELLTQSEDTKLMGENAQKIKQIVSDKTEQAKDATTEKVADIKRKAKDTASDIKQKAKDTYEEFSDKVKDRAMDLGDKAKDTIDDIKDTFKYTAAIDEDFDDTIEDEQEYVESLDEDEIEDILEDEQDFTEVVDDSELIDTDDDTGELIQSVEDEESPDEFTF